MMNLSEIEMDEPVREAFELTGQLLLNAASHETSNPLNLIFLAGDYFARKRAEFSQTYGTGFQCSKQYYQGCEYLANLLNGLDTASKEHRQAFRTLATLIQKST